MITQIRIYLPNQSKQGKLQTVSTSRLFRRGQADLFSKRNVSSSETTKLLRRLEYIRLKSAKTLLKILPGQKYSIFGLTRQTLQWPLAKDKLTVYSCSFYELYHVCCFFGALRRFLGLVDERAFVMRLT